MTRCRTVILDFAVRAQVRSPPHKGPGLGSFSSTGTDMSLPLKELVDFFGVDKQASADLDERQQRR
jgi:hypothetical protein